MNNTLTIDQLQELLQIQKESIDTNAELTEISENSICS